MNKKTYQSPELTAYGNAAELTALEATPTVGPSRRLGAEPVQN